MSESNNGGEGFLRRDFDSFEPDDTLRLESPAIDEDDDDVEEGEESVMQKIKDLSSKYTRQQLIDDFGFKRSTVDTVLGKLKKQNKRVKKADDFDGSRNGARLSKDSAIMKVGAKDVIAPESMLRFMHLPADGEVTAWRDGVLDGMNLLMLGTRLAQVATMGQAEMFKQQLDIFKAAQESGDRHMEQMFNAFVGMSDKNKEEIMEAMQAQKAPQPQSQTDNPMFDMLQNTMVEAMQPVFSNMLGKVMGGIGGQSQPEPQPPPPGYPQQPPPFQGYHQQPPPQHPPQQPGAGDQEPTPSYIERHSIDELENEEGE